MPSSPSCGAGAGCCFTVGFTSTSTSRGAVLWAAGVPAFCPDDSAFAANTMPPVWHIHSCDNIVNLFGQLAINQIVIIHPRDSLEHSAIGRCRCGPSHRRTVFCGSSLRRRETESCNARDDDVTARCRRGGCVACRCLCSINPAKIHACTAICRHRYVLRNHIPCNFTTSMLLPRTHLLAPLPLFSRPFRFLSHPCLVKHARSLRGGRGGTQTQSMA